MGINKVFLLGNVGLDPIIRTTASNKSVANLRMATTEILSDGNTRTDWHDVVCWNGLASSCQKLSRGDMIAVDGRLQTRKYEKDGVTKYVTEIVASHIEFVKVKAYEGKPQMKDALKEQQVQENQEVEEDTIPF